MWIYNLTAQVEIDIVDDWRNWLLQFVHEKFESSQFCQTPKLLWVRSQNSPEGQSFAVQLFFDSAKSLQLFLSHHDGKIEEASKEKFQTKALYFGSLLEEQPWEL